MARSDPIKYPRRSNPSKYHQELSPAITGLGRLTIVIRLADNPRSVVPTPDPAPEASLQSLACSTRCYSERLHSHHLASTWINVPGSYVPRVLDHRPNAQPP